MYLYRFLVGSFLSLLFILSACTTSNPITPNVTRFSQNIMTIDYHITIGQSLTSKQKQQIQLIINEVFQEIDTIYNKWNPHSEISKINRLAANEEHQLSPQLSKFLERINFFVTLSEGKFDPTLEPLQQLWKDSLEKGTIPHETEIQLLKSCLGWDKFHFRNEILVRD